eukprot:m.127354 g.127354  ORF g.127354 m.127354 type:complete len:348 (-) comp13007_c0_seq2:263-1306(-)
MDISDYRLKLAVGKQLKADKVNVGKLCRRDTIVWKTREEHQGPLAPNDNVFGCPLNELVARDGINCGGLIVPRLLYSASQTIRSNLTTQGLFRVNGSSARMKAIKAEMNKGEPLSGTIHDQTGLLKLWLRELPQPLFTYQLYEAFVRAYKISDMEVRKSSLLMLCLLLPLPNLHTITFLFQLLKDISDTNENMMTHETLASILTPNLIKPLEDSSTRISSTREIANHAACVGLVSFLTVHSSEIGTVPMTVLTAARENDDLERAEKKFNKLMAGKKSKLRFFRKRRRARSSSVSLQTLNLLRQSEREVENQHTPTMERRVTQPTAAFEYSRVLQLRNGNKSKSVISI